MVFLSKLGSHSMRISNLERGLEEALWETTYISLCARNTGARGSWLSQGSSCSIEGRAYPSQQRYCSICHCAQVLTTYDFSGLWRRAATSAHAAYNPRVGRLRGSSFFSFSRTQKHKIKKKKSLTLPSLLQNPCSYITIQRK